MKKFLSILLATAGIGWLAPQQASAQYYYLAFPTAAQNPGGLNTDSEYPVGGGLDPSWTTVLTGTAATGTTPVWSPTQTLPWSFQFNGQPVSSFKVSTSGVLTFTTAATTVPSVNNTNLPSVEVPDKSVCVWGVKAGAGDYIVKKVFGTAPNRQMWVQFNSCSIPTVAAASYIYWSIVLEEGTNAIYMVDQRTSNNTALTVGVQVDAATAVEVVESPVVDSPDQGDPSPADNSYYQFLPGVQPAYDVTTTTFRLPVFVGLSAGPVILTGDLLNLGTQTITSYDLNYSVNGGATVTQTITGVSIPSQGADVFTTPTGWVPSALGLFSLDVWASNLNGNPDAVPGNDHISRSTTVVDTTVARMVVEEHFTSSTCPPCVQGNINVRAVNAANPGKFVRIAYQQNFPAPGNDPYYTAESGARFQFYNGSYIPYLVLDGGVWADNSQSLTSAIVNQFHDVPGVLTVASDYTVVGRTVTVNAHVKPFANFAAGDLVLHTVVTERHTRNNARTNGETDFYNVMKKMLPDQNGTSLGALTSRQTQNLTLSYTFPTNNNVEHFDSLEVVVFVQDINSKEMMNGGQGLRTNPTGLAADEAELGQLSVAPNPAAGAANVHLSLRAAQAVSADVLDALGRVVTTVPARALAAGNHELPLNLAGLAPGLYVVRVQTGDATRTRRLVVE